MASRISELDPPRRLAFTWGESGAVAFDLAPRGGSVLLTMVHSGLPERPTSLGIAAGWHAHLDLLADRLSGQRPDPHWDLWTRLRGEYEKRLSA
jgi:uncharacterized protein YndB with AHSA1/START domain